MKRFRSVNVARSIALFGTLALVGCGSQSSPEGTAQVTTSAHKDAQHTGEAGHDHSGWWCGEHGIPEEVCSMCSVKAADEFKAKGDWCEEHNRAESQCFICEPSRAEKYAKLYQAKFGHAPPDATE